MKDQQAERLKFRRALYFGFLYVTIIILVKGIETWFGISFVHLGVFPREIKGLTGIVFAPLIHGSWEHLFNNSIPLLVLTTALFYFYRTISLKIFLLIYFIHGLWLWSFGRDSYHIGASGIIYGLGSFLFVSGIIRKNSHLLAISLLVAFLYGSMVWGIFPTIESVSWEGHFTGMASGILLAFYYKKYGPGPNFGKWKYGMAETEVIDEEGFDNESWIAEEKISEKERLPDENSDNREILNN